MSISSPEEAGQPYKLSGRFADDCGEATLKIEENVWTVGADNWDVECEGPRITIRRGPGDIVLVLKSEPPRRLIVERLNMEFEGMYFRGNQDLLEISRESTKLGKLARVLSHQLLYWYRVKLMYNKALNSFPSVTGTVTRGHFVIMAPHHCPLA
ncbi:hypothetical protein [Alishewanella longhuensis]